MSEETGAPRTASQTPASLLQRRLERLGLREPADFVVHLPLRYEDETRILPIGALAPGMTAQVQGDVLHSEVQFRPRRQLHAVLGDETGRLQLR